MPTFSDILRGSTASLAKKSKESIEWIRKLLSGFGGRRPPTDPRYLETEPFPQIGKMYFFMYDPFHKEKLPFWDQFPLVFPIKTDITLKNGIGFMGINLHYLPPKARANLMDALDSIKNNDKYDDTTKLIISYEILQRYASQFNRFEECVKLYLYKQVRSQFYYVPPSAWAMTVTLPLQQWRVNPNKRYAQPPPY